ncbi:conserved hypothetical protein [Tenacibaculum sp. 190524A05c]|uniref:hypothetical protein n=1 Tax=Tenacibaculum platacis TaxID=3137852 RepID=UPI0031FAD6FB
MSKEHDNNFELKMVGLSNFSFTVGNSNKTDYAITEGQPWGGVTTKTNKVGAIITVKAGRKKSSKVAEWFTDAIGNGSAIGCQTIDKLPTKLNFACKGTMSFTHGGKLYTGEDIIIAQGSTAAARNNWWIGGPNMTTINDFPAGVLSIIGQNFSQGKLLKAKVTFTVFAGNVSSMSMNIISI